MSNLGIFQVYQVFKGHFPTINQTILELFHVILSHNSDLYLPLCKLQSIQYFRAIFGQFQCTLIFCRILVICRWTYNRRSLQHLLLSGVQEQLKLEKILSFFHKEIGYYQIKKATSRPNYHCVSAAAKKMESPTVHSFPTITQTSIKIW